MKAITVSQPFASLIAAGSKPCENRTWPTPHLGDLAIHAGKGTQFMSEHQAAVKNLPWGAVICIADLRRCLSHQKILHMARRAPGSPIDRFEHMTWLELADHEHCIGPFCWLLTDIRIIEPVPFRGMQGLWHFPHSEDPK